MTPASTIIASEHNRGKAPDVPGDRDQNRISHSIRCAGQFSSTSTTHIEDIPHREVKQEESNQVVKVSAASALTQPASRACRLRAAVRSDNVPVHAFNGKKNPAGNIACADTPPPPLPAVPCLCHRHMTNQFLFNGHDRSSSLLILLTFLDKT